MVLSGLASCQDVIDVDLPTEDPRLVIDALIRVDTTQAFTEVVVRASESSSFFESLSPAQLDEITLLNLQTGLEEVLVEIPEGSGIYRSQQPLDTQSLINGEVVLRLAHKGAFYEAFTEFVPTVPIDQLEQGDGTLFGDDETEVIVSFTDSAERIDYYLFDFGFGEYLTSEDTFYQGQSFSFSYFYDDNVGPGDLITVSIIGVDRDFYNYMGQLIEQSGENAGPFQTPAVTVRGNIINVTETTANNANQENFALGYFAIVQQYSSSITLE